MSRLPLRNVLVPLVLLVAASGTTVVQAEMPTTTPVDTASATTEVQTSPATDEVFTVGLAIIGQIGPVLSVMEGFKESMADAGLVDGENVSYVEHNAQGDQAVIPLMARQVVDEEPHLILTLGTPVVIAVAQETDSIPIVFGAMTDPLAAGVIEDTEAPGTNLTGTSDFLEPTLILDLITETMPDAETVGIVLNPGEQNSAVQLEALEAGAPAAGLDLVTAPVASTSDVVPAASSLEGRVDAVILPQDNTVGEAYETIAGILIEAELPIFASNVARIEEGAGMVGVGVDYRTLGVLAGEQAAEILLEGADPAEIPVIFANSPAGGGLRIGVNLGVADLLGIEIPQSVLADADVYEETPYGN